jgi:hypothetical protein
MRRIHYHFLHDSGKQRPATQAWTGFPCGAWEPGEKQFLVEDAV